MRPDREEHLVYADSPDLLGFHCLLNEDLLVQVVPVVAHEVVWLRHEHHDVDALVELMGGQVRWHDCDAELFLG